MIEQYVGKEIQCDCGRKHISGVETIVIKEGVIANELPEYLKKHEYKKITVVCDKKSYGVAGKYVCEELGKAEIEYKLHLFQDEPLTPDEYAVGNLAMGMDITCDLILAVGSGTINDLCRYVSAVAGKPYCTVGTAPSMDGYIASGSALIFNNLKSNFVTHPPRAVFFEPNILANAPRDMIASGVGDLLGKVSCLTDWRLSKIINDEWHCEFISDIVDTAIQKVIENRDGIAHGNDEAVSSLLEALLLSGVCMDFADNSRPASGCEHHMSHFWEMRFLQERRPAVFHGTKVGIGTVIALKAYEYIANLTPDFGKVQQMVHMPFEVWENVVREAFGDAADSIIDVEKKSGKNSKEALETRLGSIETKWEDIQTLAKNTMKSELVENILKQLEAPTRPKEIGIEKEMAKQAVLYAKEIRDRYTVLQLLWDLGELENFADMVIEQYY